MTRISAATSRLHTKRHSVPLEQAQLRPAAVRPAVCGPHPQLVAGAGQLELGEDARSPRAIEQRVDMRATGRALASTPRRVAADAPRPVRLPREHRRRRWPAVECRIQPRWRDSASSPSDRRLTGRDARRRHAGQDPAQHVGVRDL